MIPNTKFWIAEGRSRKSTRWRNTELSWAQFVNKLRTPRRTPETMKQYRVMGKDERDAIKEMPGAFVGAYLTGPRRLVTNVADRTLITLDAVYANPEDWSNFTALHDDLACVAYPTHSSTPDKPRLRWILPVSRPMSVDEYPAVARRVAQWIGIETMDVTTYELNRLFYFPGVSDDAPYELLEQNGDPVDVDAVLQAYGPYEAWRDCTQWPSGSRETEVLLRSKERLGDPREKDSMVGYFCRAYSIEDVLEQFLADTYEKIGDDRYTYVGGSTAGGARVYGEFLYSSHATDPAQGHSQNAFDLVRIHKFGSLDKDADPDLTATKLPSYVAMCNWASELPDVRAQMAEAQVAKADAAFADMVGTTFTDVEPTSEGSDTSYETTDADVTPAADEDVEWMKRLRLKPKTGEIEPTAQNARIIMENDKRLKGRIFDNLFDGRRGAEDPLPWTAGSRGIRAWTDSDDAGLRTYMEHVWTINNFRAVQDAATLVALTNQRHPVREYLDGLTWDGVKRVETMMTDYLLADDVPLNREIAKRWMAAAVTRIYEPGRKFDTILVLVSPMQGVGKSQFAAILAGQWFQNGLPPIETKDARQALRGAWIIEVDEMAATKKTEDNAIKAFFSTCNDRYRESYGRYEADHPRQSVFIGSTNDREFITDNTGGRRFWPVDIHATIKDVGVRLKVMETVRDQLWAEAVQLYRSGTPIWFDAATESHFIAQLEATQKQHTQDDEWEGLVAAYLDKPIPDDWERLSAIERRQVIQGIDLIYTEEQRRSWTRLRTEVTIAEIRNELLCDDLNKGAGGGYGVSRHLGKVMNANREWRLTTRQTGERFLFGRQKIYERILPKSEDAFSSCELAGNLECLN